MVVDGGHTPFVVPNYSRKSFQYQDKDNRAALVPPSPQLAMSFLRLWSDIYDNPIYPLRAFSEFRNAKTRIYVETGEIGGRPTIFVGNISATESMITSGRFDFLTGLSSTNTEVIYLGNSKIEDATQTTTRIDFFETHGFVDAAKDSRSGLFPGTAERDLAKSYYEKRPSWELLPTNTKNLYLSNAHGDADLARKRYETYRTREAWFEYKNDLLVKALKNNMKPEALALPVIIAHPKAWQSYVDYRLKSNPTLPEWFVTKFLQPVASEKSDSCISMV